METQENFPKDWQIIIFAAILFFMAMQGCTTSKQTQQVSAKEEFITKIIEEIKSNHQAETITETKTTSETQITEDCDTTVWITVPGEESAQPIPVTVKFKRTTNHKEFQEQDQKKKESGTTNIDRKEQLSQTSVKVIKDKTVERTGLPGWSIWIIVLLILAAMAVLLWRLKVF